MKNLLRKELTLCLAPINILFLIFVVMIFIPNYPCYVPFFYLMLSIFFIFNTSEINRDIQYSMILPITKKDIVKARCLLIAVYEIAGTLLTIPCAFISANYIKLGNAAGIDANVAFYGLVMIPVSVFNFIFFTSFYKKAEKPGKSFLVATIVYWVLYILCESPLWIGSALNLPIKDFLDSTSMAIQIKQLPILIIGLLVFVFGWILTYKVSASRFEKVNL